jgi:diguanylate cyclase (GGDEF)-like protein
MKDPRIAQYREAAVAMRRGMFDVEIPVGPPDDVSGLGQALQDLAWTLNRRSREADELARITEKISVGMVLEEVLDQIYDSFRSVIPYHRLGLAIFAEDRKTIRARWARSEVAEIRLREGYSAPLAGSSLETILNSGRPRILNDLEDYLQRHPDSDSTRLIVEEGVRSSLTWPLIARGKPVGFLFFSSMERGTYREIHQATFHQIAGHVAIMLEKSQIHQELVDVNAKLRETQIALEHEASHDSLTGLWNRRAILQLFERELARAERDERPLSAIIVDLDHFKQINDQYGHLVGDVVLQEVSRRLTACLRAAEFCGRLGGEEFLAILCPSDEQTALQVMERARHSCESRSVATATGNLKITISLGAAVVECPADVDLSTLLSRADEALYRAKKGGRNRSEIARLN